MTVPTAINRVTRNWITDNEPAVLRQGLQVIALATAPVCVMAARCRRHRQAQHQPPPCQSGHDGRKLLRRSHARFGKWVRLLAADSYLELVMSPECSPRLAWLLRTRLSWNTATPMTISNVTKDRITGREMLCSTAKLPENYFGVGTTLDRRRSFLGRKRVMGAKDASAGAVLPATHANRSLPCAALGTAVPGFQELSRVLPVKGGAVLPRLRSVQHSHRPRERRRQGRGAAVRAGVQDVAGDSAG